MLASTIEDPSAADASGAAAFSATMLRTRRSDGEENGDARHALTMSRGRTPHNADATRPSSTRTRGRTAEPEVVRVVRGLPGNASRFDLRLPRAPEVSALHPDEEGLVIRVDAACLTLAPYAPRWCRPVGEPASRAGHSYVQQKSSCTPSGSGVEALQLRRESSVFGSKPFMHW